MASQTVTISYQTFTQGAPSFATNVTTNHGVGWLSVSPASGTMTEKSFIGFLDTYTADVTVTVDPKGVQAGNSLTGTVNFSAGGGIAQASVTMNVTSQPTVFTVTPKSLTFDCKQGDAVTPLAQSIGVTSAPTGAKYPASASSDGGWLSVNAGGGTTAGSVSVSVDVTQGAVGTSTGKVTITPSSGTAIDVPVTLNS